jgi:hypothetical protein
MKGSKIPFSGRGVMPWTLRTLVEERYEVWWTKLNFAQQELHRQVGPVEGEVHQQLRWRHGALGYLYGASTSQARARRDTPPVHVSFL